MPSEPAPLSASPSAVRWKTLGDVWIADDGARLELFDHETGAKLELDGALRRAVLEGRADDVLLRSLARIDAKAKTLVEALEAGAPRALTRRDVLAGRGFNLLFIELTAQCNERCTHCYAEAAPEREETLDWDTIRAAIDDAAALSFRMVQLTGGDPLIHPRVVDAAAHARERGIEVVEIFTNGLLLSPALLDRFAALDACFAFSVYSHDPAVHDAVTRVPGSHARTLRAIRGCVERGLRARAGVTLMPATVEQREQIREHLLALGLPEHAVRFSASRSVGRGSLFDIEAEDRTHGLAGGRGDGKACLSYDGNVYPCIFARDLPLGNVRERRLREVLEDATPVLGAPGAAARYAQARERLSCGECQTRDVMLGPMLRAPRLVQLGVRK